MYNIELGDQLWNKVHIGELLNTLVVKNTCL